MLGYKHVHDELASRLMKLQNCSMFQLLKKKIKTDFINKY